MSIKLMNTSSLLKIIDKMRFNSIVNKGGDSK